MAKRKRSETLSLRVEADIKRQIEALAAFHGTSATSLLESFVKEASAEAIVIPGEEVRSLFGEGRRISITEALSVADHEEPEITRLRLYFIAPKALSEKELRICTTILNNLDIFAGETPVFDEAVADQAVQEKLGSRLSLNLKKIREMAPVLDEWHSFHLRNKGWKSDFRFFLEMIGQPIQ